MVPQSNSSSLCQTTSHTQVDLNKFLASVSEPLKTQTELLVGTPVVLSFAEYHCVGKEPGGHFARNYFGSMTLSPLI